MHHQLVQGMAKIEKLPRLSVVSAAAERGDSDE